MLFCVGILALLFIDLTEAIPGVVMATFGADSSSVGRESFIVLFVGHMFMALEGKSVGEFGIELSSAFEAFEGLVMVALERKGVADRAPGLWGVAVYFNDFVGKEGEVDIVFEVPENCGIDLHVFETGWGDGFYSRKYLLGFEV